MMVMPLGHLPFDLERATGSSRDGLLEKGRVPANDVVHSSMPVMSSFTVTIAQTVSATATHLFFVIMTLMSRMDCNAQPQPYKQF